MTIIILHGIGGHSGIHWQAWLGHELASQGHRVIMPTLPDADHPDRARWLAAVSTRLKDIPPDQLIIIGHSLGVVTALDYLSTRQMPAAALFCVSGFSIDYGAPLNSYFMSERNLDLEEVRKHARHIEIIFGSNDPYVPQQALRALATGLGIVPEVIPDGGHLNVDAGFKTFPLLLARVEAITRQ